MMYNFLFLANKGIDIIRIDAVPYIWKELNTQCRNLKEVHTMVHDKIHTYIHVLLAARRGQAFQVFHGSQIFLYLPEI